MKKSKELENFVDKIQEKIQKDLLQIMASISNLDRDDLSGYKKIAIGLKECMEKMSKEQDNVITLYDSILTDWTLIYNNNRKDAKSLHRYLSMWFISRRLWKLQEKLSMGYCIEHLFDLVMLSIDDIITMIDKRLESEK